MTITSAKRQFNGIFIECSDADADEFLREFSAGDYDITKRVYKRSRNANGYAWQLIGQIASKMNLTPAEVYQQMIWDIGGRTQIFEMPMAAVDDFRRYFVKGHLGRKVDIVGDNEGMATVFVTLGSSDFNTKQMSQLIERISQECQNLGIKTLDDLKMEELIKEWH